MAHIASQAFDRANYDIVMMNIEKLLNRNNGNYLRSFLNDVETGTTNLRILIEDERLDPNQAMQKVEYMDYDHESVEGKDQLVNRFTDLVKEDRDAHKGQRRQTFKVQYAIVDFEPLIFQRKLDKLFASEAEVRPDELLVTKGEII